MRRVLGPRATLRWAAETRLLSELLYLSLTTGEGRQTLGEEYCDILQVAGAAGAPPGTARRGLLVLLQALGPYLADRLAAPADEDDGLAAWRQAQAAAAAGWQQQSSAPPSPLQRLATGVQRLREAVAAAAAPAAAHLPAAGAFLRDYGPTLLRIHLVLFYLYGRYYQPAKRAVGGLRGWLVDSLAMWCPAGRQPALFPAGGGRLHKSSPPWPLPLPFSLYTTLLGPTHPSTHHPPPPPLQACATCSLGGLWKGGPATVLWVCCCWASWASPASSGFCADTAACRRC